MDLSEKAKDWGKVKFDPMQKLAASTPWSQFKKELEQKRHKSNDKPSEENQKFKKIREQNRKMLIEHKRNEPKTWENFDNDDEADKTKIIDPYDKKPAATQQFNLISNDNKQNYRNPFAKRPYENDAALEFKHQEKRTCNNFNARNPFSTDEKHVLDNKKPYGQHKKGNKPKRVRYSITEEDLKDFDSRNLTPEQNGHLRAAITKATTLKYTNLNGIIQNLEKRNELRLNKMKKSKLNAANLS